MTQSFSFFDHGSLPTPRVSLEQARSLLQLFGIDGRVEELGSQQDANFLVRAEAGKFVLKISNPAFTLADLEAQEAAAQQVAASAPNIQVPLGVPGPEGKEILSADLDGQRLLVRLYTFVDGEMLSECDYLAPSTVAAIGELAGRTAKALQTLETPVPDRILQWDLRYAAEVVEGLADFVAPPGGTEKVQSVARQATQVLAQHRGDLRVQAIHGDLTDDNIIARRSAFGRLQPMGLIDFGDLVSSWTVAELAVTCASLLYYSNGSPSMIRPAVSAFDRIHPLEDHEVEALWPLIVLRAATLMVSGQQQASIDPSNAYATDNLGREWQIFEQAISIPIEVGTNLVRTVLRPPREMPDPELPAQLLLGPLPMFELDVSTESPHLDAGRFLDPAAERSLAGEILADRNALALGYIPFLQPRLTRTRQNAPDVPETVAIGMEVFVRGSVSVRAPWDGTVDIVDDAVAFRGSSGLTLWLSGDVNGVKSGQCLAGKSFAEVVPVDAAGIAVLRVQLTSLAQRPPFWVRPAMAAAWLAACIDPMHLLGSIDSRRDSDASRVGPLLGRRDAAFATVQEHYFEQPPQIERGWKNHLYDVGGRSYLDMLNNVSILGHGHPRLADAIERQWRKLNTNSRFHYGALVELSERLTALLPGELDTVFLVNSGTEAVDLALRLAWAKTGRRDVITVREAYHGWSYATDAVSTSVADNPNALSTRPLWVHPVSAPNEYRGEYRNSETHRYAQDAVAYIRSLVDGGKPPAAFLSEPFYGNAGGMALPDGYLSAVYAAIREAGGLCIADEIQVGYGRLGEHFWGFEQQGATPDIITIAKAMGNGHPLGAVVTTKAIADGYRGQGYFFSSAGGSPVSCQAGIAVLDILKDERLQENARTVGAHLKSRLLALAENHEIIGAVHGMGLYLGVELVRDRITLEPAAEETAAICERLLDLGIIMQPTSDRMSVLKIKPPLGVTVTDVDYFADMLDRVLTEGW
jgi:4-aminobutyrate aminotransferase-like enzyme/Ser/Thr protein kinase RdoA (MazF antagonist)